MHNTYNKKTLWIVGGILLAILLCGALILLGGGMIDMIRAHMGL